MNVVSEDATGCCAKLHKALAKDDALKEWTCHKCGLQWAPRTVGELRVWEAQTIIHVWRH